MTQEKEWTDAEIDAALAEQEHGDTQAELAMACDDARKELDAAQSKFDAAKTAYEKWESTPVSVERGKILFQKMRDSLNGGVK